MDQTTKRLFQLIPDKECSICHNIDDPIKENNCYITKKCIHMFHKDCVKPYIDDKVSCPYCNTDQSDTPQNQTQNGWELFAKFMNTEQYKELASLSKYINVSAKERKCHDCTCSNRHDDSHQSDSSPDSHSSNPFLVSAPPPSLASPTPTGELTETLELNESHILIIMDSLNTISLCDCECHVINWIRLLRSNNVSNDFIKAFADKIGWYSITLYIRLSVSFIDEFMDLINWEDICQNKTFSRELFLKYSYKLADYEFSKSEYLTEELIRENSARIDWKIICQLHEFSYEFIKDFKHMIHFSELIIHKKVTNKFIRENLKITYLADES